MDVIAQGEAARPRRSQASLAAVLTSAAAPPPPAGEGEPRSSFETHLADGLKYYELGRYEVALREFKAAYGLSPEPNLLYNMGRCHDRLGNLDLAVFAYRQFLELSDLAGEQRKRVVRRLHELIEQQRLAEQGAAAQRAVDEDEQMPSLQESHGSSRRPAVARPGGSALRQVLVWSLVGVGGAAFVGGGMFGLAAMDENQQFEDTTSYEEKKALKDDVELHSLLADIGIFSGAALVTTGVLLILLQDEDQPESSTAADASSSDASLRPLLAPLALGRGLGLGLSATLSF